MACRDSPWRTGIENCHSRAPALQMPGERGADDAGTDDQNMLALSHGM